MPPTADRRLRPRPINRRDTAATTGLASNPNGTYVANRNPTTAAAGFSATYGAMRPQQNRPPPRTPLPQVNMWGNVTPGYNTQQTAPSTQFPGWNAIAQVRPPVTAIGTAISNALNSPPPPRTPIPVSSTAAMVNQGVPASVASQVNRIPVYSQSQGRPDPGLIQRIAQNPEVFANLAPAQQEAVERLLTQGLGGGGGGSQVSTSIGAGSSEFMNTGFMQENIRNNTPFERQLRWDPERRRYVQIGTLIREGRLNVRTGRMQQSRRQRRQQNQARRVTTETAAPVTPEVQQVSSGFTGSYGIINFNTASG